MSLRQGCLLRGFLLKIGFLGDFWRAETYKYSRKETLQCVYRVDDIRRLEGEKPIQERISLRRRSIVQKGFAG
jgi:hypothetical protein